MSAYDHSTESAEATRAANILCAALTACFDWIVENPGAGFPENAAFQPIAFKKMSGPMAALLKQHSGWAAVLLEVKAPLAAYIPQRTAFLVPDAFVPEWKRIVTEALMAQTQQLVDNRQEETTQGNKFAEEQARRAAEIEHFQTEAVRRIRSLQEENAALMAKVAELSALMAKGAESPVVHAGDPPTTPTELETVDA